MENCDFISLKTFREVKDVPDFLPNKFVLGITERIGLNMMVHYGYRHQHIHAMEEK